MLFLNQRFVPEQPYLQPSYRPVYSKNSGSSCLYFKPSLIHRCLPEMLEFPSKLHLSIYLILRSLKRFFKLGETIEI